MKIKHDPWQIKFLNTRGDKILNCGRQIGKTVIAGEDAGEHGVSHPNQTILMIAPVERQAYELFNETLKYLLANHPKMLASGRLAPTKHVIHLTNKTRIMCYPVGLAGVGIRGLTVHRLYIDECARVPDEVFSAVTPMLMTTAGAMILLSTPKGKRGYFYDCWINKDAAFDSFTRFYEKSLDVIEEREICRSWTTAQREGAFKRIAQDKARMTELDFAQEYLAIFLDDLRQYYPDDVVKKRMTVDKKNIPWVRPSSSVCNYLGVDVASMGSDDTVMTSFRRFRRDSMSMIDMVITKKTHLSDTVGTIKALHNRYKYRKLYIDGGGAGAGVYQPLSRDKVTKRRVEDINNAMRPISRDGKRQTHVLNVDLHANLLWLLEQGKIDLFDDPEILLSFKSVQIKYNDDGSVKFFGNFTHIVEAVKRAVWGMMDKSHEVWFR